MPTYDYECQACGHRFEALQRITDDPLTKCPKCQKARLRRLIGAGLGIIFKGSGFYTTDYKRSSAAGPSKKSEPKGESKSEGAAESKPKVEPKTA